MWPQIMFEHPGVEQCDLQLGQILPGHRRAVEADPSTRPCHGNGVGQGEVAQLVFQLLHLALLLLQHLIQFNASALLWTYIALAKPGD